MQGKPVNYAVALAVLAVFALLPNVASAATLYSGSTKVPVGTEIAGSNIGNFKFETSSGTIECQHSQFNARVTENGPKLVKAEMTNLSVTGTGAEGACVTSFLGTFKVSWDLPSCMTTAAISSWAIAGCPNSTGFTINSSLAGTCHYRIGNWQVATTTAEPMILTSKGGTGAEFTKDSGGPFCWPSAGITAQYEVKTASGGGLHLQ